MHIHPDTTRSSQCSFYNKQQTEMYLRKYQDLYYPDFLNLPVGRDNFLYILPLYYTFIQVSNQAVSDDFYFTIPADIINDIKNNRGKLCFDYSSEHYNLNIMDILSKDTSNNNWCTRSLRFITNTINHYKLKQHQVIVLTFSNVDQSDQYPEFIYSRVIWTEQVFHPDAADANYLKSNLQKYIDKEQRKYKSLSLMGQGRSNKIAIARKMFELGHMDRVAVSLHSDLSNSAPDDFINSLPWYLDVTQRDECGVIHYCADLAGESLYSIYNDTYVEFCVEAYMMDNQLSSYTNQTTEKSFRPILLQKPFVIAGHKGSLQYLKDLGYKTFSNVWDESYDSMEENDRLNSLLKLYEKFLHASGSEMQEICYKTIDILEHNRETYNSNFKKKDYLRFWEIDTRNA